jgi:hypothetical protein
MVEQKVINKFIIDSLFELKLVERKEISFPTLLSKCNPYELCVNTKTVENAVDFIMRTHKQTSSKTIWGNYLELIAVKVCNHIFGGFKSNEVCTDLEWIIEGKNHYRGWKSSPNWCNADQKRAVNTKEKDMMTSENFGSFKVLTSYGKTVKKRVTNGFTQLSGQDAWEEISNDSELYNKVMVGIQLNCDIIGQFLENIYISDREKSIDWFTINFTNEDKTINFININKYVSSRDNITITEW